MESGGIFGTAYWNSLAQIWSMALVEGTEGEGGSNAEQDRRNGVGFCCDSHVHRSD